MICQPSTPIRVPSIAPSRVYATISGMKTGETRGQRIKRARAALGISQDKLAKRVGVSTMTVSRWETDTMSPEGDNLPALAAELGVTPGWVLFGEEDGAPPPIADEAHPEVEAFIADHGKLAEDEADYLRGVFTKRAHDEDVRDLVKSALEKYQLRKLRAPAEPTGGRRRLTDRDAEIAKRKGRAS